MLFEISSSSKVKIAKYLVTALQIYEQQQKKRSSKNILKAMS